MGELSWKATIKSLEANVEKEIKNLYGLFN